MNRLRLLLAICLSAAPLASALKNAEVQALIDATGYKAAHFIGGNYWTETTTGTWAQGHTRCGALGMRMAAIRTAEEADLLKAAHQASYFSGAYWIAGRDEGDIRQFAWDSPPHEQPNANVIPWRPVVQTPLTCLYWYSHATVSNVRVTQAACATVYPVLCEAV